MSGGISTVGNNKLIMENVHMFGFSSDFDNPQGSAIYAFTSSVLIVNSRIYRCTSAGSVIFSTGYGSYLSISNSLIAENVGNSIVYGYAGGNVELTDTIFQSNQADFDYGIVLLNDVATASISKIESIHNESGGTFHFLRCFSRVDYSSILYLKRDEPLSICNGNICSQTALGNENRCNLIS